MWDNRSLLIFLAINTIFISCSAKKDKICYTELSKEMFVKISDQPFMSIESIDSTIEIENTLSKDVDLYIKSISCGCISSVSDSFTIPKNSIFNLPLKIVKSDPGNHINNIVFSRKDNVEDEFKLSIAYKVENTFIFSESVIHANINDFDDYDKSIDLMVSKRFDPNSIQRILMSPNDNYIETEWIKNTIEKEANTKNNLKNIHLLAGKINIHIDSKTYPIQDKSYVLSILDKNDLVLSTVILKVSKIGAIISTPKQLFFNAHTDEDLYKKAVSVNLKTVTDGKLFKINKIDGGWFNSENNEYNLFKDEHILELSLPSECKFNDGANKHSINIEVCFENNEIENLMIPTLVYIPKF